MPANAMTRASRVERGRWKFVSRWSTRLNSKPGVMKSSVRPASGAPAAIVSRTRTEVVPTARIVRGRFDPLPGVRRDRVALAVDRVLLDALALQRAERVQPDVQGHALDVQPCEQLRREVESSRRRRGGALFARIDGLVALGIVERACDVRRQRYAARRLAVQPHPPSAFAEVLDQLDLPVAPTRLQAPRRARKRLPELRRRRAPAAAPPHAAARSGSGPRRRACR